MDKKSFQVPNIGCDGCVKTIKNELSALPGVKRVDGEVDSKVVTVEWDDPANWDKIVETLREIDYAPAGV
ncbi:MAG: heavy-metal-associated domain-containing protein [Anaerolineae bacterium]|nr:heavy-metal-associated domain-containing protein [Anaerolineae bacterium]